MKNNLLKVVIGIVLLMVSASPAISQSQWQLLNTFKLDNQPLDMMVSGDKRLTYILTDQGQILIYGVNGKLKDTLEVGRDIDQIKAGPSYDTLFLVSRSSATIKKIRVSIVENIDTRKAPFMGKANAPVTVIVFSDFE